MSTNAVAAAVSVHFIDFFNRVNTSRLNVHCLVCCLGSRIAHKRDKNKEKEVASAIKVPLHLIRGHM